MSTWSPDWILENLGDEGEILSVAALLPGGRASLEPSDGGLVPVPLFVERTLECVAEGQREMCPGNIS